jgi:nucleoside-triphosphatase
MSDFSANPTNSAAKPKLLLTGRPGVGKSTVIQQTLIHLGGRAGGFYTREVRRGNRRVGFEIVILDGTTTLLASTRPHSFAWAQPFGRYSVNLDAIERIAVPSLRVAWQADKIIVIDEIGPMEILSGRFQRIVQQILESDAAVLGTVMMRPHRYADAIKQLPEVTVIEVTLENRELLPQELVRTFSQDQP